jgi:uncharacterized protein YkwD
MVCMENYARVARGLPALHAYKPLRISATHRALEIRRCQRFGHDPCGVDFSDWLQRMRILKGGWWAGEVLAFGRGKRETVRATMTSWLGSKLHRAVLLDKSFNLVGVGTVTGRFLGSRGMRIWVSHLGNRL